MPHNMELAEDNLEVNLNEIGQIKQEDVDTYMDWAGKEYRGYKSEATYALAIL